MREVNVADIKEEMLSISNELMPPAIFVHEQISRTAARFPGKTAVSYGTESLLYKDLEALSNKLAHYLIENGVQAESKVGVCIEPGLSLAVIILGILKAGGAYIHLATSLPPSRVVAILDDADAALLITGPSDITASSSFDTTILQYDIQEWMVSEGNEHAPEVNLAADNAAYVLYTSGSTGKPKGVVIEHRNLSYYLNWTTGEFADAIGVQIPMTSSMSFAAGVTQFYSALIKGYTLHILPPDTVRQPSKLLQWYNNHPGYALYCVPTLWNEILNEIEQHAGAPLSGPARIILSGEAVSGQLIKKTYQLLPGIKVWNLYGPTEAVANLSGGTIASGEQITIGKPIPGTKLFIVKENGEEAKLGETGELLASGEGIARCYLGMEKLTEKTFINYHSLVYGAVRAYKTGDVVRLQDNGSIVYVGRNDQQVKIRGFRIELMETELAIKQLDSVKHAVVKACELVANEKTLVAYIVPYKKNDASVTSLRKELAEILPDYMLPERWVLMDEFPLLANGKIDRKQLPLPGVPRPDLGYEPDYATTEEERKMVSVFEKALGLSGIGINDNFFDLGGTSLKVNVVVHEVRKVYGVALTYRSLFEHPTPKALCNAMGSVEIGNTSWALPVIGTEETGPTPLAPNQAGLWFLDQTNKNSTAYNIPYSIRLQGDINITYLDKALQSLVARHSPLRSYAGMEHGLPVLRIHRYLKAAIELVDLGYMPAEDGYRNACEAIEQSATIPFDLSVAPLFRVQLYKLADSYLLGLVVHHIIFDGWSINVFHKELLESYAAISQGYEPQYAAHAASYLHYTTGYKHFSSGSEFKQARTFWQKQLAGTTNQFILPHDFTPSPDNNKEQGGRVEYRIDADLKERIKKLNKQYGVTPYITLMSAFMSLVYRYNKHADVLMATAVANRYDPSFYPLIGYFTNTVLVRAHITPEMTMADLLLQVKHTCLESFEHERMPYAEQIRVLHEQGCIVHPAGTEIMFAYHEVFDGKQNEVKELFNRAAKLPVFIECQDEADGIRVAITYDKNLYHEQSILQLMAQYTTLLHAITEDTVQQIGQYDICPEAERRYQTGMLDGGKKKFSDTMLLHRLFEEAADQYGEQTAIRHDGISYTYRQIEEQANSLAWHITEQGVKANDPVGIFMEHSVGLITSILAVLKTGAHYVPLDPDYPAKRNIYIAEHAQLRTILTDSRYSGQIPFTAHTIISVDEFISTDTANKNKRFEDVVTGPDSLVYIMYTSGSTGNPKGVMVPHKGVCNYVLWMKEQFDVTPNDKILAKTSISFDVSVWELFLPLISGGQLVLNDRLLMKAPEQVAHVIKTEGVSIVQFVPSGLKAFADAGVLKDCNTLEKIFCGGEKLPVQLQQEVFKQFKGDLHNLYGPTEASIFVGHFQCSRMDTYRSVPIGKPIPNSGMCILDEQLQPVPRGCTGDVYIYGDVLARGYLHDEAQTNAAFKKLATGQNPGIIYKTGDKGRILFNGNVEFHGRIDHQVKVRGYRIELGEIEQVVLQCPGVGQAVVMRKEIGEADVRLIAFIAIDAGAEVTEQDVRQYARNHLPDYMLPSAYHFVADIAVLPNGKTDFHSLETQATLNKPKRTTPEYFRGDIEKVLANIWKEVLGKDDFKPTDNFMDAGGHSILMTKVCALINEQLNMNFSIIDLFQYPSIESFAKYYRRNFLSLEPPQAAKDIIRDRIAKRKSIINERKRNN